MYDVGKGDTSKASGTSISIDNERAESKRLKTVLRFRSSSVLRANLRDTRAKGRKGENFTGSVDGEAGRSVSPKYGEVHPYGRSISEFLSFSVKSWARDFRAAAEREVKRRWRGWRKRKQR